MSIHVRFRAWHKLLKYFKKVRLVWSTEEFAHMENAPLPPSPDPWVWTLSHGDSADPSTGSAVCGPEPRPPKMDRERSLATLLTTLTHTDTENTQCSWPSSTGALGSLFSHRPGVGRSRAENYCNEDFWAVWLERVPHFKANKLHHFFCVPFWLYSLS